MEAIQKKVRDIFDKYLISKQLRKTFARFTILREIYKQDGHFSIEELFLIMQEQNYQVSKSTLYNTIDLLLECDLVKKHQFNEKTNFYEKAFKSRQHDHLICEKCGEILEFCDPRIAEIQADTEKMFEYEINEHEIYFFGICKKCRELNDD